ncbi:hypothetical protein A5N15_01625 [Rothia kristinae]|uniref:Uncharacterized protein n=1 Tax=Rothia kristinae TaxID=37923 RepID=A0A199NUP8_9MICC|nr:hypothetical protein [Rothia kristinae]OAX52642.1 hypothetical protein AN277_0201385 [Rothia kristinae]OAX67701.1 hypothetical protein A5N15_01625 [Rothia kristinae]
MTETIREELAAEPRPHELSREDLLLLLSRAAARGISVRPAVHRAEVSFTGRPGAERVVIELLLAPGEDRERILREAREEIIPALEAILGEPFLSADVHYTRETLPDASADLSRIGSGVGTGLLAA